ncbi:MAG: hypothetical protein ABSG69_09285 [Candidatus Acidiferrum sp.]
MWLEATATREAAAARIAVLAKNMTGRFVMFDQELQAAVAIPVRHSAAS